MSSLLDQPVLVTGGSGFLGRAVCRMALAAGARVFALHRRAVPPSDDLPVVHLRGDLCDPSATAEILRRVRPATIIHAAGFADANRDLSLVRPALQDNLVATVNLLSVATELGVPVVLSGSVESPTGVGETGQVTPNSPYAASKYAEACYARTFHSVYGATVVIARLAVIYGPGETRPAKLIPSILTRLMRGEPAELTSGRRRIDWVYIDDAARGMVACAEAAKRLSGQTVDVGTGTLTPVAEVATELARLVGRPDLLRLGAIPDRPGETEHPADPSALTALTGWEPKTSLAEGLQRTVDWFARQADRPEAVQPSLTVYPVRSKATPTSAVAPR